MEDHVKFRSPVKQLGFAQIEHAMALDPELSDGAFRTFAIYLMYAHQKEICWPGRERMAADRSKSEATLKRYTQELVRLGYITRKRRMNQSWLTIIEDVDKIPRLQQLAEARLLSRQTLENDEGVTDDLSKGSKMTHPSGQKRPIEEESAKDNQGKNKERVKPTPKPKKQKSRVSAGSRKPDTGATVYRSMCKLNPPGPWVDDLETITDLDRWRSVIKAWLGTGYRKVNVQGMFECYTENRMPTTKGAQHESRGGYKQHQAATEETVAAFRAHRAEKRRAAGVEDVRAGAGPPG